MLNTLPQPGASKVLSVTIHKDQGNSGLTCQPARSHAFFTTIFQTKRV